MPKLTASYSLPSFSSATRIHFCGGSFGFPLPPLLFLRICFPLQLKLFFQVYFNVRAFLYITSFFSSFLLAAVVERWFFRGGNAALSSHTLVTGIRQVVELAINKNLLLNASSQDQRLRTDHSDSFSLSLCL